jgi:hypothetical protein
MKHIPFVAFPPAEQKALLAVLRQGGLAPQRVCASRFEWSDEIWPDGAVAFTTITGPGLVRSYPDRADVCWLSELERDLAQPR